MKRAYNALTIVSNVHKSYTPSKLGIPTEDVKGNYPIATVTRQLSDVFVYESLLDGVKVMEDAKHRVYKVAGTCDTDAYSKVRRIQDILLRQSRDVYAEINADTE